MSDYSKITLGELLSSENETIKRNAISILKQLQNKFICFHPQPCLNCKPKKKEEETKCPICKGWVDIYGRCGCCNEDAWY